MQLLLPTFRDGTSPQRATEKTTRSEDLRGKNLHGAGVRRIPHSLNYSGNSQEEREGLAGSKMRL